MTRGFYEPKSFSFTERLESSHAAIKEELLGVLSRKLWSPYLDHDPRRGRAMMFLLYVRGRPNGRNCRFCPRTAAVLATIPNLRQAVFGFLPPGARIAPHRGAPGILRVHLGVLSEGTSAGWKAEGETELCVEGKVTIFDDGSLHEAWNDGRRPRVTLICDPPAPAAEGEAVEAMRAYEMRYGPGYLLRTYGKSKSSGHPYNRLALPLLLSMERAAALAEPLLVPPILFGYNHLVARHAPEAETL